AAQNATGDPDADLLNNLGEFNANSDPTKLDTDGDGLNDKEEADLGSNSNSLDSDSDGLSDFAEVKTHGTNPILADEDGDGLNDSAEVAKGTNSRKADTDNDGFSDLVESYSGTSPIDSASRPTKLLVQPFTGGDAGEGLDLDGTFVYALNVGTIGAVGKVRDADFTADDVSGAVIVAANEIPAWFAPNYGDSANDDVIEMVMQSMRWSTIPVRIDLTVTPGRRYKLQVLTAEACCARGFDLRVEGQLVADEFLIPALQGGVNNITKGVVIAYEFDAADATVNVVLDGTGITTPVIADHNPIINGLTLEDLGLATPDQPVISNIAVTAAGVAVTVGNSVAGTTYILEYRAVLDAGNWSEAAQAPATTGTLTLTDVNPDHRVPAVGFWRVRTP
ncbi:MAG TPA: hypothetical protein DCE44_10040, partial [Verrucomicrobiales bacterium]|nr:hypothetical protein [Verrucomicrobiales bacterium]